MITLNETVKLDKSSLELAIKDGRWMASLKPGHYINMANANLVLDVQEGVTCDFLVTMTVLN